MNNRSDAAERSLIGGGSREGWKTREQMEATEQAILASFAQKSGDSRGRKYSEASHAYRTEFQRDRARIIHSRAFRRLESKTQVFLNGTGDHLRTRLTHSIEVASISRTIARALSLNEDLAEAIALGHDLGHSPFGHSGEEMLAECMRDHGGFNHNRQSLRVVELLENAYPNFPGLNLTFEVREGLQKHQAFYDPPMPGEESYRCPSLEAQIANLADEITYYSHDLDDAVDFEILSASQLQENAVWQRGNSAVVARYPAAREPELHKLIIREIIDVQVQNVVTSSARSIVDVGVRSADDVRKEPTPLICYSDDLLKSNRALRQFLYENVYYHPRVAEVNQRACEMLRCVFEVYVLDPERLGEAATKRIEAEGLHRTVCDYIAGMTDPYLIEEYARIAGKSDAADKLRDASPRSG
ncbi:MAG: deoxyguanosinetriphosphate triphosphohydrolase [Verrucomicrobiota bacterium]|nr:deoxyguanosinetriphosphate triphosphohydrolase [Verrucomicrobiota bacterium]